MFEKGTYVSGDALERAKAYQRGYGTVCHHPKEIGPIGADAFVVIDFDHVLFGDHDDGLRAAHVRAQAGIPVGIHTFNADDPRLLRLLAEETVVVGKTHLRTLVLMRKKFRSKVASSAA